MKKIIVTGATGDFGQAIAHYLANQGYDLILLSRNSAALEKIKADLLINHPQRDIQCNTLDYSDNENQHLSEYFKGVRIDGVVLITPRPQSSQLFPTPEAWSTLFQDCFVGPLEFLKNCIPCLNKPGKIAIISGIASVQYMPNHNTFGVLRSMWLAQAKSLSHELGPQGIYVNTLSFGGTLTQRSIARMEEKAKANNRTFEEQYAQSVDNVPLRKYMTGDEIGSVVEFYLSDKSNHVTGTNLLCDGGFTRAF